MEQKQKNEDIFHVFSDETLANTMLVVAPKNEQSKNQKHRLFVLTPEDQNPNATNEQRQKANDLKALAKPGLDFPKLTTELPPLQLRSALGKISGIGVDPNAKIGAPIKYENLAHSFWLIASVENVPNEVLEVWGGAEKLHQLQLESIKLMHKGVIELERKRFFHPEYLDEATKKKWMEAAKKRNCTFDELANERFLDYIDDHETLKIMTNFKNKDNKPVPKDPGLSFTFKAWYMPKPPPKPEENLKLIELYKLAAAENDFPVNEDFINGLKLGFRHRRLPVLGIEIGPNGKPMWKKLPQPKDPHSSNIRAGDLVHMKGEYCLYHLEGSKGGTLTASECKIVSQSESKFVDSYEAADKYVAMKPFVPRTNKRKAEEEANNVAKKPLVKLPEETSYTQQ